MDIKLNTPVEHIAGKHAGHVTGLNLYPETDEPTHRIVG